MASTLDINAVQLTRIASKYSLRDIILLSASPFHVFPRPPLIQKTLYLISKTPAGIKNQRRKYSVVCAEWTSHKVEISK